jgi:hypothetical protein
MKDRFGKKQTFFFFFQMGVIKKHKLSKVSQKKLRNNLVGKGLLQSQLLSVGWFLVLSNKPYF